MRVLFCTTGGLGHLLPLRPLAAALHGRGHQIAWVTAPDALPRLDGQGFDLFAAGPTFEASRRQFRTAHAEAAHLVAEQLAAFTFPRLFGDVLGPAMLAELDRAVRRWRPDFVIHEPAALAVPLICSQHGLRHVAHGYGLRPPSEYLAAAMTFFEPHWRARGLAVPADAGLYRHLTLDIAPPSLLAPSAPAEARIFRFNPYRPADAAPPASPAGLGAALAKCAAPRPTIYVTFGTVFNRNPALLAAAGAAARLGGTVIVTAGADGELPELAALGAHVHVHRFVDQAALLPHCDVVVSHAGAGTLLGAAAHGVPQLLLPQAADHFRNARALSAAGAGRWIEPERQTMDVVASSLSGVLADGSLRAGAGRLAKEMAAMRDPAMAARGLEHWQACAPAQ